MKEISLTRGYVTLVDDEDYERVRHYTWCAKTNRNKTYASRSVWVAGKGTSQLLHRLILDAQQGWEVDHVDGNGLNNQRSNLRLVRTSKNQQNRGRPKNNTSGFKGVSFDKASGQWVANITYDGVRVYLGSYTAPEDAARAYDKAALQHHGEFAYQNFPEVLNVDA